MDNLLLSRFIDEQAGVVARRQVLAAGFSDDFIRRQLRRREWSRIHGGVFVNHTGPLTWQQQTWAAVLFYWPAALCHESALAPNHARPSSWSRPGDTPDVIHVAIEHPRRAVKLEGVRLHRLVNLDSRVRWHMSPPRLRLEEAALDVCSDAPSRTDALAIVTDLCQQRRTTPARLIGVLERRKRMRFGTWLRSALSDVALGAMSMLEQSYLRKVERAHGLPRAQRQLRCRTEDGVTYRDVEYEEFNLVVELDGRVGHEFVRDRWKDMDRDLLTAVNRRLTVRIGWSQVEKRSCVTAARIGSLLQQRGWTGAITPCGDCTTGSIAGTWRRKSTR